MTSAELLTDAYGRVLQLLSRALKDIAPEDLGYRPDPGANSIAWLAWHLTRIQDDHLAAVGGWPQVWTEQGWLERFALPFEPTDTGHGHDRAAVAVVGSVSPELLLGYHQAVNAKTTDFLAWITDADLDRVVDTSYDPPVTLGVRLMSVLSDNLQHAGQAAYLRGLTSRRV